MSLALGWMEVQPAQAGWLWAVLSWLDSTEQTGHAVRVDPADRDDIQDSLKGDGDAYARLVRRYQQAVAARMRHFSRDPLILEELAAEVFVEAYFALPGYRGDAPLLNWLHRIATRVGYRFWQQQRRRPQTMDSLDCEIAAAENASPGEAAEVLDHLLGQLSPRDRLVVTLLYIEEESVADTARLTGWSQSMVKVQAFRARRKLRKLLEKDGGRP